MSFIHTVLFITLLFSGNIFLHITAQSELGSGEYGKQLFLFYFSYTAGSIVGLLNACYF